MSTSSGEQAPRPPDRQHPPPRLQAVARLQPPPQTHLRAILLGGPLHGLVIPVDRHADLPAGWYGPGHTGIRSLGSYRLPHDPNLLRRTVAYRWTAHDQPPDQATPGRRDDAPTRRAE